jgi:hypothetical protein
VNYTLPLVNYALPMVKPDAELCSAIPSLPQCKGNRGTIRARKGDPKGSTVLITALGSCGKPVPRGHLLSCSCTIILRNPRENSFLFVLVRYKKGRKLLTKATRRAEPPAWPPCPPGRALKLRNIPSLA